MSGDVSGYECDAEVDGTHVAEMGTAERMESSSSLTVFEEEERMRRDQLTRERNGHVARGTRISEQQTQWHQGALEGVEWFLNPTRTREEKTQSQEELDVKVLEEVCVACNAFREEQLIGKAESRHRS